MKARAAWVAFGGLGYALALLLVGQLAFSSGFLAGLGLPANFGRTGTYDSRLSQVAAVDPDQMARAVSEASGGPPTIAAPPPPPVVISAPAEDPTPARSQPRAAPPTQKPAPASSPPGPVVPPTLASLIASLPPNWQATLQAQLQKQKSPGD